MASVCPGDPKIKGWIGVRENGKRGRAELLLSGGSGAWITSIAGNRATPWRQW